MRYQHLHFDHRILYEYDAMKSIEESNAKKNKINRYYILNQAKIYFHDNLTAALR